MIAGIVLAAGGATRFGRPKQLAELADRPLLEHALAAVAAAALPRRFVVLGSSAELILGRVELHGAEPVVCDRWREGQARSVAAGLAAAADAGAEAAVICLGDQPLVGAAAIERVVEAWRESAAPAARATYGGAPGHPVVVARELFDPIMRLAGDRGPRDLLARHGARAVPCDDLANPADIDTEADLDEVREAQPVSRNRARPPRTPT